MISTRGRYALRLMLELALDESGKPVKIKTVAQRQEISDKYLEQIIALLSKGGYVKSVRGAHGGYLLTMEPREYTVGMILRVTEGSLAPTACISDEDNGCEKRDRCVALKVWRKLDDAINEVVDHITLADLVDWSREE